MQTDEIPYSPSMTATSFSNIASNMLHTTQNQFCDTVVQMTGMT